MEMLLGYKNAIGAFDTSRISYSMAVHKSKQNCVYTLMCLQLLF